MLSLSIYTERRHRNTLKLVHSMACLYWVEQWGLSVSVSVHVLKHCASSVLNKWVMVNYNYVDEIAHVNVPVQGTTWTSVG